LDTMMSRGLMRPPNSRSSRRNVDIAGRDARLPQNQPIFGRMSSKSSRLCASTYRHEFRKARTLRHRDRRDGAHRKTGSRAQLGRTECGPRQRMSSRYSKQLQYPESSRRLRSNKNPSIKDQQKERVERKSKLHLRHTMARRRSSIESSIHALRTSLHTSKPSWCVSGTEGFSVRWL
jgi:hypothetical protein